MVNIHASKAFAYFQQEKYDAGVSEYHKSIKLEGTKPDYDKFTLPNEIYVLSQEDNHEEAIALAENAITLLYPDYDEAYFQLGEAYKNKANDLYYTQVGRNIYLAEVMYQESIRLNPRHRKAWCRLRP